MGKEGSMNPQRPVDIKLKATQNGIMQHITMERVKTTSTEKDIQWYLVKQERRLKRRNTLGGLEISIRHK